MTQPPLNFAPDFEIIVTKSHSLKKRTNMKKEETKIFALLEQAGMNPQLCDTPVPHDHRGVRCGQPTATGDELEKDYMMLPHRMMGSSLEFIVDVVGDSMKDVGFESGDHIKVRTGVNVRSGDIVVARVDGEFTVKVLFTDDQGRRWLVPQNEHYVPILLTESMDVNIVGHVIELIKDMPSVSCAECMKVVRRSEAQTVTAPDGATIERAIVKIAPSVENGRQWYAVYRALRDRDAIGDGDYASLVDLVGRLVPDHPYPPVASELRRLSVLSFRRSVALWDRTEAPVVGKRFDDYLRIARTMLALPE